MEIHQILFVIFFISSPLAISAWDIAVAVENEIQFLNNSGHVVSRVSDSMVKLQALTYSPEEQLFFYSDNSLTNGSIFSFHVSTDAADTVGHRDLRAIVTEQSDTVQNIVYDHKTQILYWTNGYGHQIKWLKLGSSDMPRPGQILFNFKAKVPTGIAIDSCKRYLYWTNCQRSGATIERSLLDGSKLEVLVEENLDQPLGIVLDQGSQRMFWIDDLNGNSYKIESATFTGQNRMTVIHGSHHQPFSLTISAGNVFWTDRTNTAVWKLPMDGHSNSNPIHVLDMDKIIPTGVTSANQMLTNSLNLECSVVVEPTMKVIKANLESISPTIIEETEKLHINVSNYCLNQGLLKDSMHCDCPARYSGSRCEVDKCHNYCLNGVCEVDASGQARCRKCVEGWSGEQCQINVCHNYCVRGTCYVKDSVQPTCECHNGWSGDRCEIWHFEKQKLQKEMLEICRSYCRLYTNNEQQQQLQPLENCRCSEMADSSNSSASSEIVTIGELQDAACMWKELNEALLLTLSAICIVLLVLVIALTRKIFTLRKRPRIKKRIIVSKSVTPLTRRPQPEQCEITIENCCNMNICETPCFEPEFRTPHPTLTKSGKKEENRTLLGNMELPPDDLY